MPLVSHSVFLTPLFFVSPSLQSQCLRRCGPLWCEAVAGAWSWSWEWGRSCCSEFQKGPERSVFSFHAKRGSCWALFQWCSVFPSHCTGSLWVPWSTGKFFILRPHLKALYSYSRLFSSLKCMGKRFRKQILFCSFNVLMNLKKNLPVNWYPRFQLLFLSPFCNLPKYELLML